MLYILMTLRSLVAATELLSVLTTDYFVYLFVREFVPTETREDPTWFRGMAEPIINLSCLCACLLFVFAYF